MLKLFLPIILTLAALVGSGEIVHACVTNGTGVVRIVAAGTTCDANETALEWGVVGLRGQKGDPGADGPVGPAGAIGPQGAKGDPGAIGPAGPAGQDGAQGEVGPKGEPGDAVKADPPCFDNSNRYVDCGNGTVHDTVTGLLWLKDANCLEGGVLGDQHTYQLANEIATTIIEHGECGLSDNSSAGDWRLPTEEEWTTTVERAGVIACSSPSLTNTVGTGCYADGPQPFINVQSSNYWSSTSLASISHFARSVNLDNGLVFNDFKTGTYYVWPVRGGQ